MSEPLDESSTPSADWPAVDVVIPVRNEETTLESAVGSVLDQAYPGSVRVILAVAPSEDRTREIAERLAADDDLVTVVDNPRAITPAGLNRAIEAGDAPVVVRVDGHSELEHGYVRLAVEILRATGSANVGGRQVPHPDTSFEHAVAAATQSRLGTGGATYRVGGTAGPVETVYLGVFDRAAIEAVGLFDEELIRNQDYELNIRLRESGRTVWFDPRLAVGYRPRGTLGSLARQYYQYGQWKAEVLRRHPSSLRLRQLVPPIAMALVAASLIVGLRRPSAAVISLSYLTVAAGTAVGLHPRSPRQAGVTAFVFPVIHTTWSAGLVVGLFRSLRRLLVDRVC